MWYALSSIIPLTTPSHQRIVLVYNYIPRDLRLLPLLIYTKTKHSETHLSVPSSYIRRTSKAIKALQWVIVVVMVAIVVAVVVIVVVAVVVVVVVVPIVLSHAL